MNERAKLIKRFLRIGIGIGVLCLLLISSEVMARTDDSMPASANTSLQDTGTLRVIVFDDVNENEVRNRGEPGVSGINVEIFSTGDDGGSSIDSETTNSSGEATFTLDPGNYRVTISIPDTFSYATLAGEDRFVSVLADLDTEVTFPVIQVGTQATATTAATSPPGETPTTAPTFTATLTPTVTPSPTNTSVMTNTPVSTDTPGPTATNTSTPTQTATPTQTTTPTPTGTLFPITPILITTTPGVFVTTTPIPGVTRLPDTGVGSEALLWAVGFGALMLMAAGLRRFLRRETG